MQDLECGKKKKKKKKKTEKGGKIYPHTKGPGTC